MNDPSESMEGASLLGSSPGRYSMFRNGWLCRPLLDLLFVLQKTVRNRRES